MPKETLIAIGAGVLSAILATAFLSRVPGALVFVYLASLPLFVAGLALGPRAGMVSSAVGFMAVGLVGGGLSAGLFGLMPGPSGMDDRQADAVAKAGGCGSRPGSGPGAAIEWYPLGDMLCWLTMLAAAMLVLMAVAAAAGENGLSALVALNLNQILQSIAPEMDPESLEITVGIMAPCFRAPPACRGC